MLSLRQEVTQELNWIHIKEWKVPTARWSNHIPHLLSFGYDGIIYMGALRRVVAFSVEGHVLRTWEMAGDVHYLVATNDVTSLAVLLTALSHVPAFAFFPPGLLPICAEYAGWSFVYAFVRETELSVQLHELRMYSESAPLCTITSDWRNLKAVTGSANGVLYLAVGRDIQVFAPGRGLQRTWRCHIEGQGEICAMAVDDTLALVYVVETLGCVHCFETDGTLVTTFDVARIANAPGIWTRFATVMCGCLIVGDITHPLCILTPQGKLLGKFPPNTTFLPSILYWNIAGNPDGTLCIMNRDSIYIRRMTPLVNLL